MPIGLPDIARHGRGCDGDARRRLKGKASSVFPAPARPTLAARDHGEACAINRKFSDPSHGISAQAYNILAQDRRSRCVDLACTSSRVSSKFIRNYASTR